MSKETVIDNLIFVLRDIRYNSFRLRMIFEWTIFEYIFVDENSLERDIEYPFCAAYYIELRKFFLFVVNYVEKKKNILL